MCLQATTPIKTATRSITCYKLLDRFNGQLTSPFQGMIYELGETKTVSFFTDENSKRVIKRTKVDEINAGLHAYRTLYAAMCQREPFQVIVRCSIPKGTKYIKGYGNEIAALKLVIKEIM